MSGSEDQEFIIMEEGEALPDLVSAAEFLQRRPLSTLTRSTQHEEFSIEEMSALVSDTDFLDLVDQESNGCLRYGNIFAYDDYKNLPSLVEDEEDSLSDDSGIKFSFLFSQREDGC